MFFAAAEPKARLHQMPAKLQTTAAAVAAAAVVVVAAAAAAAAAVADGKE